MPILFFSRPFQEIDRKAAVYRRSAWIPMVNRWRRSNRDNWQQREMAGRWKQKSEINRWRCRTSVVNFSARTITLFEPLFSKLGGKSFYRSRATVVWIILSLSFSLSLFFVFCFTLDASDLIGIPFFASFNRRESVVNTVDKHRRDRLL